MESHRKSEGEMQEAVARWKRAGLAVRVSDGLNALCGDEVSMALAIDGRGAVAAACWSGFACSLCALSCDCAVGAALEDGLHEAAELTVENVARRANLGEVSRSRRGCVELPLNVMKGMLE